MSHDAALDTKTPTGQPAGLWVLIFTETWELTRRAIFPVRLARIAPFTVLRSGRWVARMR